MNHRIENYVVICRVKIIERGRYKLIFLVKEVWHVLIYVGWTLKDCS